MVDLSVEDFSSVKAKKLKIIPSPEFDKKKFHPSGVTAFERPDGRIFFYTASILYQQIDVFEISINETIAKHLKTIRDPLFHTVDDLIMVSENSFYVTNLARSDNQFVQNLELTFKLSTGSVVFYDGKKGKEVLTGIKGANGIGLSPDKKQLYLGVTLAKELHVYDILSDHSLKLNQIIPLYIGADNFNVDESGIIWSGAHPIFYQAILHLQDPDNTISPSQVLKIDFSKKKSNNLPQISTVYSDPGDILKASSTALRYKDRLLVGTVFDKLLLCELVCH